MRQRAIRVLTCLVPIVRRLPAVLPSRPSQLIAALGLLLAATAVGAFVPQAERVAGAIADSNGGSGRAQALRIELEMRVGDGPVVARGEIVTHPTGMARLELRGMGDLVEKHILQGALHLAARNGERLSQERTREFLPPVFLLQIDSAVSLGVALQTFGIDYELVGLAPCDERDCYVLGDPDLVPPPPPPPEEEAAGGEALGESPGEAPAAEGQYAALKSEIDPTLGSEGLAVASVPESDADEVAGDAPPAPLFSLAPDEPPATLWVDTKSFDVRRMRLAGDVRVLFGPYVMFKRVRIPSWVQIVEERGAVRFDVLGVTPVNAPASAFAVDWLVAPTTSPAPELFPAGLPKRDESLGD